MVLFDKLGIVFFIDWYNIYGLIFKMDEFVNFICIGGCDDFLVGDLNLGVVIDFFIGECGLGVFYGFCIKIYVFFLN